MRQLFTILLLFCLLTNLSVCGQTDKDIIIGAYDSIQSEILKEDIDKAIENYKKALAINDNQETRDKLEKLKKE